MTLSSTSITTMPNVWLHIGCCLLLLSGLGCGGSGNSARPFVPLEGPSPKLVEGMTGVQAITNEGVTVYYSQGLNRQAERFAALIAEQYSHVLDTTGLELKTKQINVYLKFAKEAAPQQRPRFFFAIPNGTFSMELFVESDNTSCEDIIAANRYYPYVVMHEIIELSLSSIPRPQLLSDYRHKTFWGRNRDEFHYTRWFREGFASYAGFLACKTTLVGDGFSRREMPSEVLQRKVHQNPLSSLARVGKRLFVWNQYQHKVSGKPQTVLVFTPARNERDDEIDHYDAALGLFLVIEAKYGRKAIREITQMVNKLENGDGEDLKRIVSQVLGRDIVEFAEAFSFPKTGLDMVAVHPPYRLPGFSIKEGLWVAGGGVDGLAKRAGIRRGDVIVSLDGDRTVTNFGFEFALYRRMHQQSVNVGIYRKGAGRMTIEMNMD